MDTPEVPKIKHAWGEKIVDWPPAVLLIELTPEGYFLNHFTSDGIAVGDTFHQSLADAKRQAILEFGPLVSYWYEVPEDEEDPVGFALHKIQPRWEFPGVPQPTRLVAHVKDDPEGQHPWAQETVRRPPAVLLIERSAEDFVLSHYARDGERIGDSSYQSLADAKHQAAYEFGGLLSEWRAVPENVEDAVRFALRS